MEDYATYSDVDATRAELARRLAAAENMAQAIERFLDPDVRPEDYWKGTTMRKSLTAYRALVPRK